MQEIEILRPSDFHVHLRDSGLMRGVVRHSDVYEHLLVMPNLEPAIRDARAAGRYRKRIERAFEHQRLRVPNLIMTIKITDETTPAMIEEAARAGIIAAKVYPVGTTTGAQKGVSDFKALGDVWGAMRDCNMVLCLHGEVPPPVFSLDREPAFIDVLTWLVVNFPGLRMVVEHISTAAMLRAIERYKYVAGTITVHHLLITLDDVIGDLLEPHNFCKPIAKRPQDRDAILQAVLEGHPKLFLGTDSAPHLRGTKERARCCAGVYSAPVALQLLAQIFDRNGALDKMEGFTSIRGPRFYRLNPPTDTIWLQRRAWQVHEDYRIRGCSDAVVPFMAGETIDWQLAA